MKTKISSILVWLSITLLLTISFTLSAAVSHQSRSLSFADRVAYQRAIEVVYWQHRIWPQTRTDSKPSLDAEMSQVELEKEVTEYLRNSRILEDQWQRPITPDQLQAEMDRMAEHTRQSGVLRELFTALGNDPYVIAECLARPVLAERLVKNCSTHNQESLDSPSAREAQEQLPKVTATATANYRLPVISVQPGECADSWTAGTSTFNSPEGRSRGTAVWTGTEMIVWGGFDVHQTDTNTGGRYNPSTDSWTPTSTINAPSAREQNSAVWTGSEMIIWGGFPGVNTGGKYNPNTDSWTPTSTTNAPAGRWSHTTVWTGSEMIVWGGWTGTNGREFDTGGIYDPGTDSWRATSTTNVPQGRVTHTAVWTGSEMIIWGGINRGGGDNILNTGGKYNPGTDSWTATTLNNAPIGRLDHTAVWTGTEMIVWGGDVGVNSYLNTGGRYNPGTDSWTPTSLINAPSARGYHTTVWTGSEMIVWGGGQQITMVNTGGRYNPGTDSWTATSLTGAPSVRGYHTAVWTGGEMIVWGGWAGRRQPLDTGGRYCGQGGESITLEARVIRQGGIRIVVLSWSPADGGNVNVLRDGAVVATTDDDGTVKDKLGTQTGTFTYQVCETDSGDCSNEVTVRVRGAAD